MRDFFANIPSDRGWMSQSSILTLLALFLTLSNIGCVGATGAATKPIPTITTEALSPGQLNEQYSARIAAQGGVQPYHWSVASGRLPAGIALSSSTGELQGTPSTAGTTSFLVKLT